MSYFEKGRLLIGVNNAESPYCITTRRALMVVLEYYDCEPDHDMLVGLIGHTERPDCFGETYYVHSQYFEGVTAEEYKELYPDNNAFCNLDVITKWEEKYDCDLSTARALVLGEDTTMATRTTVATRIAEVLTDNKVNELTTEISVLLKQFDYNPTDEGIRTMLNEWAKNKYDIIKMFEKHPNYNGKYQIVFDYDYERVCDPVAIRDFCDEMMESSYIRDSVFQEAKVSVFTYDECVTYYEKYNQIAYSMQRYPECFYMVNNMTYAEVIQNKIKWSNLVEKYQRNTTKCRGKRITRDSNNRFQHIINCFDVFRSILHATLTQHDADNINYYLPELKAAAGQKTSRAINKLCKLSGADTDPDFNKKFAKYSDAINPLMIKRHTILSCHPVDYLTMSFGNSWSSCHTIDKKNKRRSPHGYEGMYSGGTLSYMLDGASMVLYTVDASYNGNEYELQDKINRNMFHFGKDKLVQGRVYPQANDGNGGIYQTFREIVQKLMSECMDDGVNAWLNVKGYNECGSVIESHGVHYRDYENFDVCNVSYYNKEKNPTLMKVGHSPICPSCGRTHRSEKWITCSRCR